MTYSREHALHNMERIQSIFKSVQQQDLEVLTDQYLESFENSFQSVAYEAAAMTAGLIDIEQQDISFTRWNKILSGNGQKHATQIHIGLGWAFAQSNINPLRHIASFDPFNYYRIFDGYGYYEGFFRKRKALTNREIFTSSDVIAQNAYYQGLGRSLWYSCKADIAFASSTISSFPQQFQKDMWRGLGIAIAYVGGCNTALLTDIVKTVGVYRPQLAAGVAMGTISRIKSDSLANEFTFPCEIILGTQLNALMKLNTDLITTIKNHPSPYQNWIIELEKQFS